MHRRKKKHQTARQIEQDEEAEMLVTMRNWGNSTGERIPSETKQLAKEASSIWAELDKDQRSDFMIRYKATKQSKHCGWMRNFQEKLSRRKQSRRETVEKHFTRHSI